MRHLPAAILGGCLALAACKSDADKGGPARPDAGTGAADAAAPAPPPTAEPSPSAPEPGPEPVQLGEKLRPLVDAVATDGLVSEDLRLLLDGLDWPDLEGPLAKRLGGASKADVVCAYARVHAAKGAVASEPHDPRLEPALADLEGALARELTARKLDPAAATRAACGDAG